MVIVTTIILQCYRFVVWFGFYLTNVLKYVIIGIMTTIMVKALVINDAKQNNKLRFLLTVFMQ